MAARRAGLIDESSDAAEAATAKIRRVLPEALGRRLDTLLATASFTAPARRAAAAETDVLLSLADATRQRRPVTFTYTDRGGRTSRRTLHPHGIVAHGGRWYVTGEDAGRRTARTFRVDRIRSVQIGTGSFVVPDDVDPTEQLLTGLADTPWRHEVSVRVQGTADEVRARLPIGLATVRSIASPPADEPWVRLRLRAERLDWVPALLASLDRAFVIEHPDNLRDVPRARAHRLLAWADRSEGGCP